MTKAKTSPSKKSKPTSSRPKKADSHSLRNLVLAIVFVLVALAVLVFGLAKVTEKPVESFLPEEQTAGFLEFEQALLPSGLNLEAGEQSVVPALQVLTGLPLSQLPQQWWNYPFGLVLMEQSEGENAWVLFAQGASRRQLMADLKQSGLEKGNLKTDQPLYTYTQGLNFSFGFSNHYVFISHSMEAIDALKTVETAQPPVVVAEDAPFQALESDAPSSAWLKVYLRTDAVNLPTFPAVDYALSSMSYAMPHVMMAIEDDSRGLNISTLLQLAEGMEKTSLNSGGRVKKMADYVSKDSLALFFAGPNLTEQWQATLTDLSSMNPAYGVILESLVRAQVQDLFGGNVSLRNDLYPLFQAPYGFVLSQQTDGFALGMVMDYEDRGFTQIKLDKLLNGFYALVGQLNPQVKVVILPDGTESRELVASSQNAEETVEEYGEFSLTCLSAEVNESAGLKGEVLRNFCYTLIPERFYMATSPELLKQMVDANPSLSSGSAFKQGLGQVNSGGDTLTYVDMQHLAPLLSKVMKKQQLEEVEESLEEVEEVSEEIEAEEMPEEEASDESEVGEEDAESEANVEDEVEEAPSVEKGIEEVQESLLVNFLSQLGQSTWSKTVSGDQVRLEGFVGVE